MIKLFFILVIFASADVAAAQEATTALECGAICQVMKGFPELNAWILAVFTALGLILRAIADLLAFIGSKVEQKAVGEWGKRFNSYALWAAQIIGWFGGGTPKAVLEKKMEAEKK